LCQYYKTFFVAVAQEKPRLFASIQPFQPSLMFVRAETAKVEDKHSMCLQSEPSSSTCLSPNIRLDCKGSSGTNALAYWSKRLVMKKQLATISSGRPFHKLLVSIQLTKCQCNKLFYLSCFLLLNKPECLSMASLFAVKASSLPTHGNGSRSSRLMPNLENICRPEKDLPRINTLAY
jgi:hypothetical protein